jgi:hypothetical protein
MYSACETDILLTDTFHQLATGKKHPAEGADDACFALA